MLGQVVISGLLAGALYAMVALGLGLIFGVMRVLNVSHGPLLMLGAYTTFWLFQWLGLNPYLSLLVTMPLLFLVGMALQRLFVRRVVDAPELSSLLLTFGVSIAIVNLAQLAFTADLRSVEYLTGSFGWGPFAFSKSPVIACAFAIVITTAAFLFPRNARPGKPVRAPSPPRSVAQALPLSLGRHRLRHPLHAPALHVDRSRPVVEPDLRAHGLCVVRSYRVLRHGRLSRRHPHRQARLALAPGQPRRRRGSDRAGHRDRLALSAPEGSLLRHFDAGAQRGPARGGVLFRRAHGRGQRALPPVPLRQRGHLLFHGDRGAGRDRPRLCRRHLALWASADDDPRGRDRGGGHGHRYLPLQALRVSPLRCRPGYRGRPRRARSELYRAGLRLPAHHDHHDDRDGALRRQGHDLGAGARGGPALHPPGDDLVPLHLCPPAPLRCHHRHRGALHAPRHPGCPAAEVQPPPDHLVLAFKNPTPRGAGWGRGHPPRTRIFCAPSKPKTSFSWLLTRLHSGPRVIGVRGGGPLF